MSKFSKIQTSCQISFINNVLNCQKDNWVSSTKHSKWMKPNLGLVSVFEHVGYLSPLPVILCLWAAACNKWSRWINKLHFLSQGAYFVVDPKSSDMSAFYPIEHAWEIFILYPRTFSEGCYTLPSLAHQHSHLWALSSQI